MKMRIKPSVILIFALTIACSSPEGHRENEELAKRIVQDEYFAFTKAKALEIIKTGFNAGDGYGEVWIRDYNTFIELSSLVYPKEELRENLLVFFRMQGDDGNIIDGFIPVEKASKTAGGYDYIFTNLEPRYAGHKNTVETDQESSLVQAVHKYRKMTGDTQFLNEVIDGKTVAQRLENSLEFLMNHRFNEKYGLIWGATTADWGDVQPEHDWGVYLTNDTHYAIDIYDNAMLLVAIDNFMEMVPEKREKWQMIADSLRVNCRKHLWDAENTKFIPHIYLNGSPFPADFNENEIYYHGGTAIAIEAGLLSKEEIKVSLNKMLANVRASGAGSIGLTMYPPYPEGYFKNKGMYPYGYQNGGDWTWFGGRMIQELIKNGFVQEAYDAVAPMVKRVKDNNGFYEWYTVNNEPKGSGTFRGEAGVLFKAILLFEEWSKKQTVITLKQGSNSFRMPEDYLRETENIPEFWLSTYEEVTSFLENNVHKGKVEIIGKSAGGRAIRAVFYGSPRQGRGTTTFSGSLGFRDVCAYRGPDHDKKVYWGMSAVHGGEFEGIVGTVNLISIIETGRDLRGKEWPEITDIISRLDRLILIPVVNPDGRVRIPLRMEAYRGTDYTVAEFLNTGGKPDGTITGWPQIKEFIPMDFSLPGFPGGYPNDAGVNIQHDDFFGDRQPETQALFNLAESERPDLILNMHTGAVYPLMLRPFGEPVLYPVFDSLFKYVHSKLAVEGLQDTNDPGIEGDSKRVRMGDYNLDGALNLHCGALSVVVESPSHSFSGTNGKGKPALLSPDMLIDAQLFIHQEAMRFLVVTGGRSSWTPARNR